MNVLYERAEFASANFGGFGGTEIPNFILDPHDLVSITRNKNKKLFGFFYKKTRPL